MATRLERFAATTAIRPRPDLHARVLDRLAHEPPATAPRRFMSAVAALDGRGAWRAFRQSVATVTTARPTALAPRTTTLVRAQALVLVVVVTSIVALTGTVGGIGAAAGIASLLDGDDARVPQAPLESPSPEPTREAPAIIDVGTPEPTSIDQPTPPPPTLRPTIRDDDGPDPRATEAASRAGDEADDRDEDDDHDEADDRDERDESDDRDERDERDEADERDDD